jgi:hypothetical protein
VVSSEAAVLSSVMIVMIVEGGATYLKILGPGGGEC